MADASGQKSLNSITSQTELCWQWIGLTSCIFSPSFGWIDNVQAMSYGVTTVPLLFHSRRLTQHLQHCEKLHVDTIWQQRDLVRSVKDWVLLRTTSSSSYLLSFFSVPFFLSFFLSFSLLLYMRGFPADAALKSVEALLPRENDEQVTATSSQSQTGDQQCSWE